jgi:tetratricopeptide (TPR) repeat protein
VRLGIAAQLAAQLGHRMLPLHRLRPETASPGVAEARSEVINRLAWMYYFADHERLVLVALLQLNLAERRRFPLGIVRGSSGLGFILDAIPAPRFSGRYHRRAVRVAAGLENRGAVALAHLGLAHFEHHLRGRWTEGLDHYRLSAAAAQEAADLRTWGAATIMICGLHGRAGELAESAAVAAELVEVASESGDRMVLAWGEQASGRVCRLLGDPERARAHLERGIELSKAVPDYPALVTTIGLLGLCELEEGLVEQAVARLEEGARVIERHGLRGFHCTEVYEGLAAAYLAAAEGAGGRERARLLGRARQACRALRRQARLDSEVMPAAFRLAGTYRWLRGRRGQALRRWRWDAASAETLGSRYDLALAQLELGRRAGDAEALARGGRLLEEIRAGAAATVEG